MARSLNNGLGFWIHKDVIEDVFRSLKYHCCSTWIVLADSDLEGLHSHLIKHHLLLMRIHVGTIFLKRIAEPEVKNSCLSHLEKSV